MKTNKVKNYRKMILKCKSLSKFTARLKEQNQHQVRKEILIFPVVRCSTKYTMGSDGTLYYQNKNGDMIRM